MSKRVLLYVQHLLGVGHVKRAAAIARSIVAKGIDVTVAIGGMPVPNVSFPGATVVQLPPARSPDAAFSSLVDETGNPVTEDWWQARERALMDVYQSVNPDLILVEHFPFGRRKFRRELEPVFVEARKDRKCRIVGSVRDILIAPSDNAKTEKMIAMARTWFNKILVHADPGVIRLEDTFPAAAEIADLLAYTGYIVEDDSAPSPATNDGKGEVGEVIVSAGGGAVGEILFQTALNARKAGCLSDRTWRFLAGGNLDPTFVAQLQREAPAEVVIEPARPDFPDLLKHAALSISQAGYNTVMDLLVARCPAIVVPFATGGETEQTFRAEKFAAAGLLTHLPEYNLSADTLNDAAKQVLERQDKRATSTIDLTGMPTTGAFIDGMLT